MRTKLELNWAELNSDTRDSLELLRSRTCSIFEVCVIDSAIILFMFETVCIVYNAVEIKVTFGIEPILMCLVWFVNSQSNKGPRFGPGKQTLLLFPLRLWTRLRRAAEIPRSAVRWPASIPRVCFWPCPQKSASLSLCFLPGDFYRSTKLTQRDIKWRCSSRKKR